MRTFWLICGSRILPLVVFASAMQATALHAAFPVEFGGGFIHQIAPLKDGKILVQGSFSSVAGEPVTNWIARLNSNGTLDTSFNAATNIHGQVVLQPDQKLLIGAPRQLFRLYPDGSFDRSFFAEIEEGSIKTIALQPDGAILVGGNGFTGVPSRGLIRLHSDGSLDTSFRPGVGEIQDLILLPDGKILAAQGNKLLRFLPDGTFEQEFFTLAANVERLFAISNGEVLVFSGDTVRRIRPDGYEPPRGGFDWRGNYFGSLAGQADTRLVATGDFSLQQGAHTGPSLVWLNADGTVDNFRRDLAGSSMAVEADGNILASQHTYTEIGGEPTHVSYLHRLQNSAPATQFLTFSDSTVTWTTLGAAPDITRAVFQKSTNGVDFVTLGQAARFGLGRWRLSGVSIEPGDIVRAQGWVSSLSEYHRSDWIIETEAVVGSPVILLPPQNRTNAPGTMALFGVSAAGVEPLTFLWLKNGNPLSWTGGSLVLTNIQPEDAGLYSVVVSNALGTASSASAELKVQLAPMIIQSPLSQAKFYGSTFTLQPELGGEEPFSFQWFKDEVVIPGATNRSLTFSDVQASDAGAYRILVTNVHGSALSSEAIVTVSAPPTLSLANEIVRVFGSNVFRLSIDISSDLQNWTPFQSTTPGLQTTFSRMWQDPEWTSASQRFYRLRIE